MNEGICDFRFAICDLGAMRRRKTRRSHDRGQFGGFLMQGRNLFRFQQAIIDNQFHPVSGFIRFFLHGSQLRNKLGFRTDAARSLVIGSDRHSTADQLPSNSTTLDSPGQGSDQLQHAQGELLSSLLQFSFVHKCEARNSQGNRKSQIANLKSYERPQIRPPSTLQEPRL